MSYDGPPIKEITDEWIEECENNPNSIMLRIAKISGILPSGVDPNDPRVKAILSDETVKG